MADPLSALAMIYNEQQRNRDNQFQEKQATEQSFMNGLNAMNNANKQYGSLMQLRDMPKFKQELAQALNGNLDNPQQHIRDIMNVGVKYGGFMGMDDQVKGYMNEIGRQSYTPVYKQDASGNMFEVGSVPKGTKILSQGGAEKPPTQAQETTALYASRIKQSNDIFDKLSGYINNLPVVGTMYNQAVPNFMKDPLYQSYDQAQRNFLNAVLRRESGAVISPSEFDNGRKQYFPQPGDSPDVVAQKRANRDLVMKNFITASRSAYVPYEETQGIEQNGGNDEYSKYLQSIGDK